MCLVTEHVKLKKRVAELEAQLPHIIIPVTDLTMISRQNYLNKMAEVGISPIDLGTPLDVDLSITTKAELDRIAPELVQPADDYISEIRDCEDYGIEAQSRASKYRVSGIRLVLGDMPLGYHGFVISIDVDYNIWWLEPNAGFPFAGIWHRVGDEDYYPDKVFA